MKDNGGPAMISMDKQYRYHGNVKHQLRRVLCVDRNGNLPVLTESECGDVFYHAFDGACDVPGHDLIEVVPLWRGELWVKDNGQVIRVAPSNQYGPASEGWRRIDAVEVRKEDQP